VSPDFWLYWAVTIPVTLLIVGLWLFWERRRRRMYEIEDRDLELSVEEMERDIMKQMLKTTKSKFGY
jgi:cytochrome c-type biogenesis protein CcmH/NrfF